MSGVGFQQIPQHDFCHVFTRYTDFDLRPLEKADDILRCEDLRKLIKVIQDFLTVLEDEFNFIKLIILIFMDQLASDFINLILNSFLRVFRIGRRTFSRVRFVLL